MALGPLARIVEAPQMRRQMRHPRHQFELRHRPWQLQPFMIAPVLPGETMKSLTLQSRCVTDPIKNPLIGWWLEYFFFYVKLTDLDGRNTYTEMLLDPSTSMAALRDATARPVRYQYANAVDYTTQCLKRVTEEYFRNDGEAWDTFMIGTTPADLPVIGINYNSALNSIISDTAIEAVAVDPEITVGIDDVVSAREIDNVLRQYEFLKAMKLTTASYEDYLATYGVRPKKEELHIPELIRHVSDWTYPSNTIDPTNGTPRSACSWSVSERADKDRFFREPGFVVGYTVARPKVYMSKQVGSIVGLLDDAYAWLPALLSGDTQVGYKRTVAATPPITVSTDAYWIDLKDLFIYGDQFVNFALTETDAGLVAVPTAALEKNYATATDADALFVAIAPANQIRQDGMVTLSIAARLGQDTSART